MKISTLMSYTRGFIEATRDIVELEKAGLDMAWVPEPYSFDAVSALGYIAARTDRLQLGSGILNIYSRTPALLAMTAAGLDALSEGRFTLGLGASGPQVIEGFHGVPFDAPTTRLREVVEICRKVWLRQEKLTYQGNKYTLPLPKEQGGSGLGTPLKLINHPYRNDIPIALATIGEQSVEMTAEIADIWLPAVYMPERAHLAWGNALKAGAARRDPARAPLEIFAGGSLAIGEGLEHLREHDRPGTALYLGGMGARKKNFYNQVFRKYGYDAEGERIQELYLSGRKAEAEAAIPADYIEAMSLVGPESFVRDRLEAFKASGVTSLLVAFHGANTAERVKHCDALKNLMVRHGI